jgi:hypothetical protein
MYRDIQGAFTHFLRLYYGQAEDAVIPSWLGNLPEEGPWPTYLIEVKSTTNDDHARPFYVSGLQYETVSAQQVTLDTNPTTYTNTSNQFKLTRAD